jgi:hypothetical protein
VCGADDVWEPRKLEWQLDALRDDPRLDVLFRDAEIFGVVEQLRAASGYGGGSTRPCATGCIARTSSARRRS